MNEEPRQLDPTAVAIHYKKSSDFWEGQAKSLLDQVLNLEKELEMERTKNAD